MFTRDFKKPLLSVSAVAVTGGLFGLVTLGFVALSNWAERDLESHPFKQEDWLRYLLPAKFGESNTKSIMLLGPSTVRENLRYEQFQNVFPRHTVVQGGISLGTIEDAITALEYVANVYGQSALPDTLILGVSPRFIAGIPKTRPFRLGIDLYSPHFNVVDINGNFELVAKGRLKGMVSAVRFLGKKQPERYRIALFAMVRHGLLMSPITLDAIDKFRRTHLAALIYKARGLDRPSDTSSAVKLSQRISPYKYSSFSPIDPSEIYKNLNQKPKFSWWDLVFTWDAAADHAARLRLGELLNFTVRYGIQLLVVNMPERDIARNLYRTEYQNYLDLVKGVIGETAFFDLREFLEPDEFHDAEHSTVEGARRLTKQVIVLAKPIINMK